MKNLTGLLVCLCLALQVFATQADGDAAAKYQSCATCHGEAAQGNVELGAPALAGQGAAYLQRQLQHFKAGVRGADPRDTQGAQMKAMAGTLSDDDIMQITQYLAGLPKPGQTSPVTGDLKNGNNYYQAKCGACHGGQAQGNAGMNTPALVSLDAAYLKAQFEKFRLGLRGAHPEDTYGRQMKMMSTSLPSDKDLDDVIAYIQSMVVAQ